MAIIKLPKGDFLKEVKEDRREAPRLDIVCVRQVDLAFARAWTAILETIFLEALRT